MEDIKALKIRKSGLVSFCLGFSGAFLMVFFQLVNFHPAEIIRPIVETQVRSVDEVVLPRLEKIRNNFNVKKKTSIIPKAYGARDYESAKAYGAIDFDTGNVIEEKNLDNTLPIASVTKIMTAVVALDLADKDYLITINSHDSKMIPTKIGVVPGQKMTLEELMNAMLLTSANDAAETIKDGINEKYNKDVFVEAMNEKAKFLGLNNSHFQNPQGFDSKYNYSTVRDLATLTHYALANYPLIASIVKKDYEFLPANDNHKQFDLYNWNGLIGVYPNTVGVKIGNTDEAGKTTIVVSERDGKKVISIVLGAPGILERDLWASQILDDAFSNLTGAKPINVTKLALENKYKEWKYWN
ncbi:MAG TPA: serine hydrolase [Patescibacteria group bacterium]|nr:serine hydrolase [Patescibacteria group bacterium]